MGLRQNILTEPVTELELRPAVTLKPDATVRQVLSLMQEKKLGCIIIVDDQDKPVGKFTERQIVRLLLDSPAHLDEPVGRHMLTTPDAVRSERSIASMVATMQDEQLRFICITDAKGKAAALSGQKGLMEYIAEHFPRQVKVQRMQSKLYMDEREGA